MTSLKTALVRWEIFRLPYNLILLVFGLIWSWPLRDTMKDEAWFGYWGSVLAFGFTANIFYTVGPAAESYFHAFCHRTFGSWRWMFLALGLLVSIGLTWTFVWSMEILYIVLYPSRGR